MKLLKHLLLSIAMLSFGCNALAAEKIHFAGNATYPPFEFFDKNNEIIGFDVELTQILCQRIKAECNYTHQLFDSLIPSLKVRRIDAIASGMSITSERKKQIDFTQSYHQPSSVFVVYNNKINADQLKTATFGVQNGTIEQNYIAENLPQAKISAYDSFENAFLDLKNNRVDVVFCGQDVVAEFLKKDPKLSVIGDKVNDEKYFGLGFGIAVRKGNDKLLQQLDAALTQLKASGELDNLKMKWLGYN